MDVGRRTLGVSLVVAACGVALHASQAAPAPAAVGAAQATVAARVNLTPEETEVFLREAPLVPRSRRDVGTGVTDSQRATLSNGRITHDVHIQRVNVERAIWRVGGKTEINFRDSYRFNIAGSRLARLIGLSNVPVSVERMVDGRPSAVTWWLDDVSMDEKERIAKNLPGPDPARTSRQVQIMRIFDELIQNSDRNQGNIVWTTDWTLWMIDHTRAFRMGRQLVKRDQLITCDRALLDRLRALTPTALAAAVGSSLTRAEAAAVLARRDLIVKHYDDLIATRGEAQVLFTLNP